MTTNQMMDNVEKLIDAGKKQSLNIDEKKFSLSSSFPTVLPFDENLAIFLSNHLTEENHSYLLMGLILYANAVGNFKAGGSVSPIPPIYYAFKLKYPKRVDEIEIWMCKYSTKKYYFDIFGSGHDFITIRNNIKNSDC